MAKVKLQYLGSKVHRDADQFEDASLTVEPGDIVEVSEPKAAELLKGKGADNWKRLEAANGDMPPASTSSASGSDPKPDAKGNENGGGALSSANTPTKK